MYFSPGLVWEDTDVLFNHLSVSTVVMKGDYNILVCFLLLSLKFLLSSEGFGSRELIFSLMILLIAIKHRLIGNLSTGRTIPHFQKLRQTHIIKKSKFVCGLEVVTTPTTKQGKR